MKFLDFFSGIGGFRLGMEMAGHECLGHCEIDKYAHKSYEAMHRPKESEWYANDITRVEPRELPEADVYCGGFPCQAFSIAGNRGGFEDTRGTLFFEVMRLAKVRKPKYLFLENVKGLLSHDNGRTFAAILTALWECGYDCQWALCNSKDFGVPQNRERVFIVGHLRGSSRPKVFPIGYSYGEVASVQGQQLYTNCLTTRSGQANGTGSYVIESEQYAQGVKIIGKDSREKRKNTEFQYASCLTARGHSGGNHSDMDLIVIPNAQSIKQLNNPTHSNDRVYSENGLSPCLNTMQGGSRQSFTMLNNGRIRRLTPRECFRLQGFPDEYFERAATVCSDSQLYKQAGNSVTVNVINEIARRIK